MEARLTLEELLDCDAAKLESLTDAQLLEWFKPFLNVTRPELASKEPASSGPRGARTYVKSEQYQLPVFNEQQRKGLAELAAQGIDISFASKKVMKKK